MRIKSVSSLAIMAALVLTFAFTDAEAGFPSPPGILIPPGLPGSSVNVNINGYLPAPPGVHVRIDSGRPYYVESNRRVYMEKEGKHHKKKHYKKHKRHHDDRGNHYGRDNRDGRGDHGGGRGGHGR